MPQRLLIFFLLLAFRTSAQPPNFVVYSLAQGLPQSQVFATLQDSRGYIWMGTQGGGLCRFDGLDFQIFTTAQGLPSNYVNALYEDAQKRLWVGTNAGVCFLKGKVFEKIPQVESRGAQVVSLCQTTGGQIWVGTDRGIFACDPDARTMRKIHLDGMPDNAVIWSFFQGDYGLWIATDAGAFRANGNGTVFALNNRNGLLSNVVRGFARGKDGVLWLAALGAGLTAFDEKSGQVVSRVPEPNWPTCLLADRNGRLWIGTSDNGLLVFNPADKTWTQLSEREGFPHQYVRAVCSDKSGNIWAGTSGGGVAKIMSSQQFTQYGEPQGLNGTRVYALLRESNGKILLAVSQSGLETLDSSGIYPVVRDSGWLNGIKTKTLAQDAFGRIWVGTEGKGVAVFDSFRMSVVPNLPAKLIQKIIPGEPGEMWIATTAGLAKVNYNSGMDFSLQPFGKKEGLAGLIISTIFRDGKNNIWFADQLGNLGLIQDNRVKQIFGVESGLPGMPLRCITTDAAGRLWVGTKGAGICFSDSNTDLPHFTALEASPKPASDNIYLLIFDAAGNLWAGSESGVDRIAFAQGKVAEVRHFGKNEGFLGIETCQDAALCDPAGNLWFGTMNGLMRYTPGSQSAGSAAPLLHFEEISLFYKPIAQTKYANWFDPAGGLLPGLELPWNQNHLSFEFRAVDPDHPDALRYRWLLDGLPNPQWSPLSEQSAVNFAGLPPGTYTFSVEATSDGELFSQPLQASFIIQKPFWLLPGFQLAVILLLTGAIVWFVRARIRRIKQAEAAKRAQLELQNHLLQLEQKALQLQMNPHFIFNTLNSIQSLVGAGDAQQARAQIGNFAQLMRGILNNSRKPMISLKEEADTLEQYLQLEQFCQQQKFEYRLSLPDKMDAEEIEIPPMLIQPFVENAVIHGVSHLKHTGQIVIGFTLENGLLRCSIRDNGIGREAAARLRRERNPGHQSVAMSVTRERLEAMKGSSEYTAFEINDLKNDAGEITGTEVIVRIPATLNF